MHRDGFTDITNIDYSSVVINNMKKKYNNLPSMKWAVMDIRDLKYCEHTFDVVIEKGTLDSLLVDETNPWSLSDDGRATMDCILTQVSNNNMIILWLPHGYAEKQTPLARFPQHFCF